MARIYPEEVKEHCLKLMGMGKTPFQVKQRTKVPEWTLRQWRRDAGNGVQATWKASTAQEMADVYEMHLQGIPSAEIAERVGRDRSTVNKWIRAALLELDRRGTPKNTEQQAKEVRDDVLSEVPWWARRCPKHYGNMCAKMGVDVDWQGLQRRLAAIDQPEIWWYRRRDWTIGKWAEYALRHNP